MLTNLINNRIKEKHLESFYNKYFKEFNNLMKNIPNSEFKKLFKHFDIRFRLALDTDIKFNKKISKTKSKRVQNTYELLIKLSDFWFAYEGLIKVIKSVKLNDKSKQHYDLFSDDSLNKISTIVEVNFVNQEFRKVREKRNSIKREINDYLLYLKTNSGNTLGGYLERCMKSIKEEIIFSHSNIMSIIYAIRNMHVHNIDTARTGFNSYEPKIILLRLVLYYLIISTFKTALFLIAEKKRLVGAKNNSLMI